jgi:murein DD-endopeptidase MepM/ murein hydrolase activator NlpD
MLFIPFAGAAAAPTLTQSIGIGLFGASGLNTYLQAGTGTVPWTLLAAIDLVETGTAANPDAARLEAIKSKLSGSSARERISGYSDNPIFISMVENRMYSLSRIDLIMLDYSRVFPLASSAAYYYTDDYGAARDFGGERTHEGIDIICDKGTPVRSVCNGTVTKKGWLTLGGWRIGVEDENGVYYYYAHLSQYGAFEVGDTVRAGDILGYSGSTGYGPEGTDTVMIPHLHFGMYENDVAFNPYVFLRQWEVTVQPPAIVYNSRDEQLRKADTEGLRECGTPDRGVEA